MSFTHKAHYWPVKREETLNITYIESEGSTLEELIENSMIYLENWRGGQGPDWSFDDFCSKDQEEIIELFNEHLADKACAAEEQKRERELEGE